jgi:hypothetical protein
MKITASSPAERRRQTWLLVLLVVVAAVMWFRFRPAASTPATSNPVVTSRPPTAETVLPEAITLSDLDEVRELPVAGRNPFAFGVRPPPPPPPAAVMAPMPMTPPPPPVPSGPPPIGLRLTGVTRASETGRLMVTLKDPTSGGLYQAFEGDIVDGRYRVVKVGERSVVLSYVDGSGTRTVGLGG